jgi:apolipoprotein N-acyltransferase
MAKESNTSLPPWALFLISAALFAAGWLMKPFPLPIFFAFAPLFAIADQARQNDDFWINTEFILLSLVSCFLAAFAFNFSHLMGAIVLAIVFTLSFVVYTFCFQQLGNRLGKFTIVFFWLATEYLLLKLPWRNESIFLADVVMLKKEWLHWTSYTGYLGGTLWILLTNLFLYMTLFKGGLNKVGLACTLITLLAPAIASYFIEAAPIARTEMIGFYQTGKSTIISYSKQGELLTRTSAWISVVIILLALVKNKTAKK